MINFLTFNVRSLSERSRQIDLVNTLKNNKIDICFIQECHLKRRKNVILHDYNFLCDYSSVGVAIAIKNTISYTRLNIDDLSILGTFIQIELNTNILKKKVLLGSLYIKCNSSAAALRNSLEKIGQVASGFDFFLLGGDLNSKSTEWGDTIGNSNGNILQKWLEDHSLDVTRICNNSPSYPNGNSFLDHYLLSTSLINVNTPNFKITTLPTFSDHFPLVADLRF